MNYKEVLENQIEELQKLQKRIVDNPKSGEIVCEVAKTISALVEQASKIK